MNRHAEHSAPAQDGVTEIAENESLDLGQPGGQRWKHVLDAVRRRSSVEDIAGQIELKLPKALRKAHKELAESGVTFGELMAQHDWQSRDEFYAALWQHNQR